MCYHVKMNAESIVGSPGESGEHSAFLSGDASRAMVAVSLGALAIPSYSPEDVTKLVVEHWSEVVDEAKEFLWRYDLGGRGEEYLYESTDKDGSAIFVYGPVFEGNGNNSWDAIICKTGSNNEANKTVAIDGVKLDDRSLTFAMLENDKELVKKIAENIKSEERQLSDVKIWLSGDPVRKRDSKEHGVGQAPYVTIEEIDGDYKLKHGYACTALGGEGFCYCPTIKLPREEELITLLASESLDFQRNT